MFDSEESPKSADDKSIEQDLKLGLSHASIAAENISIENVGSGPVKPNFELPKSLVGFIVDRKNDFEINYFSKDLDEDAKEIVSEILRTTPEEVEVWKAALEQTGNNNLPAEYIETLNKYLNSPMARLIESEAQKLLSLRGALAEFKKKRVVA